MTTGLPVTAMVDYNRWSSDKRDRSYPPGFSFRDPFYDNDFQRYESWWPNTGESIHPYFASVMIALAQNMMQKALEFHSQVLDTVTVGGFPISNCVLSHLTNLCRFTSSPHHATPGA